MNNFTQKIGRFMPLILVFFWMISTSSPSHAQIDYEDLPNYHSQEWFAKHGNIAFAYCMIKNSLSQSMDQLKACADGEILKAKKVHYMEIPKAVREKIDEECTTLLAREKSSALTIRDPKDNQVARMRAEANAWICIRDGHIAAYKATLGQTNPAPSRSSERIEREQKPSMEKKTRRNEGIELSR